MDDNLKKDIFDGLTDNEVKKSREEYGENRISKKSRKSFLLSFFESFGDPMIKVLLIALGVNIVFLFREANWFESLGIGIAILLATLVSTMSEYGSESAFEKLQEEAAKINCRARRSGALVEIPSDKVVVGDIILLQAGDRVPADGVILSGKLDVDQSALNGESKEAKKYAGGDNGNHSDFLNPAILFSSTIVCAGEAFMRVTKVGDKTFYGRIGSEIQEETRESPLKLRLGELAKSIGVLGYFAAGLTSLAYFFNVIVLDNKFVAPMILHTLSQPNVMLQHLLKACTLAVTVIVMAVPEGLPMMITVVLSANMKRMLKDNVLVRKLVGIETAGSLNILFSDKTGTLTKGQLDVTHFIGGSGNIIKKSEIKASGDNIKALLFNSIFYNCASSMSEGKAIGGNATDRALIKFVCSFKSSFGNSLEKINTIPFSGEKKFMATTVSGAWKGTFIKGAPEKILPFCQSYYDENCNILPITNKEKINGIMSDMADKAVRLIAVAVSDTPIDENSTFGNLKLVGLIGIRDDIRREAVIGVRQVQGAGIQTVMITGDSKATAFAIAKEAGIVRRKTDIILTSDELRRKSDNELIKILPDLRVVARALPADKSRLVRIAQSQNLVVGMTGDGVNDAPALKQADIGFAMGSGTEVAKEAGDIVILDDNFMSISKAICYGRTIFKSIRKFIIYQLSICMCAVGVTVIGPLLAIDFPITVIQMLWINIVMDTLAGMAFSGEKAREKYMREPPKLRNEPMLNGYMKGQVAVNSIYSTILCLVFLKNPLIQNVFHGHDYIYTMTAFFGLFMFLAIFTSFCARTHQINLFEYLSANKLFIIIMGLVTVIQIFILYFGGAIFRTVQLHFSDMLFIITLALTIIPVDMIRKYFLKRNFSAADTI